MDLLNLCLTSTYFQYKGKHYKQLHGTAMGSTVSVVVAEFVMQNIEEQAQATKKWLLLIALQFRYTFYRPQTTRLRARKIGLQYEIRHFVPRSPFRRPPSVTLRTTCREPARIWVAVIDFQNGEQQSRSGSDKKRRNRLR